jgi:hypothetical protein
VVEVSRFGAVNTAIDYSTTGLGIAGSIAGSTVAAGTAATGAAGTLVAIGSAATIVGLVAVPVMILLGKIFHGADPRQVPASQIEQAFEVAAFNVMAVGRAGMLSRSEVLAAIDFLRKKGEEFYRQTPGLGKAGTKGLANMRMVLNAQVADAGRSVPVTRTKALDLGAAKRLYIPLGKSGYYAESLQAATRLTDQYLSALPKNVVEKAANAVGKAKSAVGKVASALDAPVSESLPVPTWALAGAVGLLGMALGGKR